MGAVWQERLACILCFLLGALTAVAWIVAALSWAIRDHGTPPQSTSFMMSAVSK